MGVMIAHVLNLGDVIDYIPVVAGYGVLKLTAPSYFVGSTISQIGFGEGGKSEVAVLLIERQGSLNIAPDGNEKIEPEDVLIVGGNVDRLEELFIRASRANAERNKP
jgi:trk system potassium uptake protein TrkA